jgi:DDE family transposase
MHVATIRRRHGDRVYESHLVRRSIREGKRVRHETIANVSRLPPAAIEALRRALRGEALMAAGEAFAIEDPLAHGHVEALLGAARRLGLARLLDRAPSRERDLALALICGRVIAPGSKLATARALHRSTLAAELCVEGVDQDDLYAAMDWLLERQGRIEGRLARRHLHDGELVLYDVSSSYFEGRTCPLAELGFSRDGRRGTLQVVYGLLCDRRGCPVSVEVFAGSLHDDKTLPSQLAKLRDRFALKRIVVVSDRGMVTKANLDAMRAQHDVAWITALKAPQVKRLARRELIQPSLFDEHSLAEITDPDEYPGERLIVCRNPLVAAERARKREDLLEATERELADIARRVQAGTLAGEAEIGLAAGAVWNRYRVKKHFRLKIADTSFAFARKSEQIAAEAALDGIYVIRTSVADDALDGPDVVRSYKQLKEVERAFRSLKGPLEVRPIHHRLEDRVRAHLFLCMLAYYLEWHLRQAWTELLFNDEQPPTPTDPVAKASRSAAAERKARTKRTANGRPCHSFRSLLDELALRTRNTIRPHATNATFTQLSEPTELHTRALALLQRIPNHA